MHSPRRSRILGPALPALVAAIAVLAAITALAAVAAVTPANAAPPGQTPDHDRAVAATVGLPPTTSGDWVDVPNATVTLRVKGAYEVAQQVRGQVAIPANALTHAWIASRLVDATGAEVPESRLLVTTAKTRTPSDSDAMYGTTATGHVFIDVGNQPVTVKLQASLNWDTGTPTMGWVITDRNGFTKLVYKELA